jgi:hypothetical protein
MYNTFNWQPPIFEFRPIPSGGFRSLRVTFLQKFSHEVNAGLVDFIIKQ